MTALLPAPERVSEPASLIARGGLLSTTRFEARKLLALWRVRVALLACALGPIAFDLVIARQSTLPADTVFGRWLRDSGYATPLVVLSFAGTWLLPVLAALVAGDIFAAEDRLGTWRGLLVAVRDRRRIFVAKVVVALLAAVVLVAVLALSSILAGLTIIGTAPVAGLDGAQLTGWQALGPVLGAWASVLAPTLAFAAIGLLCSVAFGRSPVGLALPVLLAVGLELVALGPLPVPLRTALVTQGFLAWRGLLTHSGAGLPLLLAVLVGLGTAVLALVLARRVFLRRDFTDLANDGVGLPAVAVLATPFVLLVALTTTALVAATGQTGDGITQRKLEGSLAASFGSLYELQQRQLGHPPAPVSATAATASCDKGGSLGADHGPGNDWRCVVTWHVAGATARASAIYQLDVAADGRYVADGDGPKEVNGFFVIATPRGSRPNPLWQFDGLVDLLTSSTS